MLDPVYIYCDYCRCKFYGKDWDKALASYIEHLDCCQEFMGANPNYKHEYSGVYQEARDNTRWTGTELESIFRTVAKARRVAGSVVISIPKEFLQAIKVEECDTVQIIYAKGSESLTIKPFSKELIQDVLKSEG